MFKELFTEDSDAVYNAAAKDHSEGGPAKRHQEKIKKGIKIKSKHDIIVYQNIGHNRINLMVNGEDCQLSTKSLTINENPTSKKLQPAKGSRDWYNLSDMFTDKEIQDILKAGEKI